jgi:hypothetical protein
MMNERVALLNFIYANKNSVEDPMFKKFISDVRIYLLSKQISYKNLSAMVIYDGPSNASNLNIFVLRDNVWVEAEPEDKRVLSDKIAEKYELKQNLNKYVGFIGFETNKKYMVYKVKDTTNSRSTGFRCDQSGKEKVIDVLNEIENDDKFKSKVTKDSAVELCIRQELTLRQYQRRDPSKIWFLDTEAAIYNEFEKRDKK